VVTIFRSCPESVEEFGHSSSLIALLDTLDLCRDSRDVVLVLMEVPTARVDPELDGALSQIPYRHCDNKWLEY